jgi:hypothetical protein
MGKRRPQLTDVDFHCSHCDQRFATTPERVIDAPQDEWHPWAYVATCPVCAAECEQSAEQRRMLKMWANATGPKTDAGKAAVRENLRGHPTPEEAQRTRFNGLKHGLNARVATYFPAKPGAYAQCDGCVYLNNGCSWADVACRARTELYMKHQVAFESRDPSLLTDIRAELHANLTAIIEDIVRAILGDGVRIKRPEFHFDSDGGLHLATIKDESGNVLREITRIEAHPLLRPLKDLVASLNLGLADLGMTPKAVDDAENIKGFIGAAGQHSESLLEYQQRQAVALEGLRNLVTKARDNASKDPIYLEHAAGEGDG